MTNLVYYVGVDHREPDALAVTEFSARAYASKPLPIGRLEHNELRQRQLFDRPWRIDESGGYWDERDGKPFSVQFSHTRFLTPIVAKSDGHEDWALFSDSDWLHLADPYLVLNNLDETKTVYVVPHNFQPTAITKMDGRPQATYQRKLWSAFMLWNLKSKKLPTVEMVNAASGNYLHRFGWLDDTDIGFLSEAFHWVPNHSPTTDIAKTNLLNNLHTPINAVHFTFGPPVEDMVNREVTAFDSLWRSHLKSALQEKADMASSG